MFDAKLNSTKAAYLRKIARAYRDAVLHDDLREIDELETLLREAALQYGDCAANDGEVTTDDY